MIKPDKHHDWLDQRAGEFSTYLPMGSKDAKKGIGNAMFEMYSSGVATGRDVWIYNSSKKELSKNMKTHIDYANSQDLENPIIDSKRAKWTEELSGAIRRTGNQLFDKNKIRTALYRPFFKQYMYFDKAYNHRRYQIPKFFPQTNTKNPTMLVQHKAGKFSALVTDSTSDLNILTPAQCFPLKSKNENVVRDRDAQSMYNHSLQDTRLPREVTAPPPMLSRNLCIIVPNKIQGEFSVFITDITPDLEVVHHGQVFPMKVME